MNSEIQFSRIRFYAFTLSVNEVSCSYSEMSKYTIYVKLLFGRSTLLKTSVILMLVGNPNTSLVIVLKQIYLSVKLP